MVRIHKSGNQIYLSTLNNWINGNVSDLDRSELIDIASYFEYAMKYGELTASADLIVDDTNDEAGFNADEEETETKETEDEFDEEPDQESGEYAFERDSAAERY